MVLMFTGQRLVQPLPFCDQDKNWFFNGIDVYRTTSCLLNTFRDFQKLVFQQHRI